MTLTRKQIRQALIFSLGILLILVGIVGLFLPFLQGMLFIFLGTSMIAPRFARRIKNRLFRKFLKNEIVRLDEWKKRGVDAGFTTRRHPLFIQESGQLLERGGEERFLKSFPAGKFAVLKQVHGAEIAVLDDPSVFAKPGLHPIEGTDGAVTDLSGVTLLVFSADCLPVFFVCGKWIGLVHAGWRGTRGGIAAQAAKRLIARSGLHPREIRVAFGPAVSAAHYEVGPEFRTYFRRSSLTDRRGKLYFDLAAENATQLVRTGVKRRHILDHEICTFSESDSFYSFRREGDAAGRMISFITKV